MIKLDLYKRLAFTYNNTKEQIGSLFYGLFYKKSYESMKTLRNKHYGKPAVLIGGGPSINKMDLNKYKDYITIACNGFYLKMEDLEWSPTYYTVEDPLPAKDNSKEISSIQSTTKIIPYNLKRFIKKDKNTIYTNFLRSYVNTDDDNYPYFSFDCQDKIYWGGTVMYYNIQLAAYMGCNPIYLIGVDLNYFIPSSAKVNGIIVTSTEEDNNHFDSRWFGPGKKWHLPETDRMQQCFTKAFFELEKKNIDLFNAGIDSKLKVIPKVSLD